jgi:acyl-CoA dehydrogenase
MPNPFALGPEQAEILEWVRKFADTEIRPVAAEWDEREETPWPVIRKAAEVGLYGLDFLVEASTEPSGLLLPAVMEELAAADAGITLALFGSTLAATGIMANGTAEQRAEWLPRCFGTQTDPQVAAFIASEPEAGSDVGSLRTRAVFDATTNEWVLNGRKSWGTNGGIADVHVIVASVDHSLGTRGQASFVIPASSTPGITQGSKFRKMGIRASHTAEVVLEECRIPAENVLGGMERLQRRLEKARNGEPVRSQAAMATFEASRPMVGAMAVGIARAAYEYALAYAKERVQFGRPIVENQAIAFKLADMRTRIDAARLLVQRAAMLARDFTPFSAGEGSMAKLYAGETAVWVTDEAIQVLGGAGYTREHPVERYHRDAKIFTIFEGTSEIQRLVIARALSGHRIR